MATYLDVTFYEKLIQVKKQGSYLSHGLIYHVAYRCCTLCIFHTTALLGFVINEPTAKKLVNLFYKWKIDLKETDEGSVGLMVCFLRKKNEKADQESKLKLNLSHVYTLEVLI